jgi:regulator of sigma E protease
MAILFKIKVEKFSIGIGPAIYKFQKGDTSYQIGWLPLGGFCKFKGDEINDDEKTARDPDSFYGAPAYKRLLVALFGPAMNYVLAIIFLTILAMGSVDENYNVPKIQLIDEIDDTRESAAKIAGLQTGDLITHINGKKINKFMDITEIINLPSFKDFINTIILDKDKIIKITYLRNGKEYTKDVKLIWDPKSLRYLIGIYSFEKPVIDYSEKNKVQNELGLKFGDEIIGIDNDYKNISIVKLYTIIGEKYNTEKKSILHIRRDDKNIDIPINFSELSKKIPINDFQIDFQIPSRTVEGKNIFSAIGSSFADGHKILI